MMDGRLMASDARKLRKSCESLIGICTGLLADGALNEQEIRFLDLWLRNHQDITSVWPGEVIAIRVREVMEDGVVTHDELAYIQQVLTDLIGDTLQNTGITGGMSTRLPVNDDRAVPIYFTDTIFCFTGNFLYGTRAACERAIIQRGCTVSSNIVKNLDYLVLGTMVSESWANTSYGRKIEKAIEHQQNGSPILIISEEHWVKNLYKDTL